MIHIPDNEQNSGEKTIAKFLSKLPDTYWIYRELKIKETFLNDPDLQKQPDFVIITPDYGIIIIEVKDWDFQSNIYRPIDQKSFLKINKETGEETIIKENPFDKAQKYLYALSRIIRSKAFISSFVVFPRQTKSFVVSSFTDTSVMKDPQSKLLFDINRSIFKENIDQNWLKPENLFKELLTINKEIGRVKHLTTEDMIDINRMLIPNYWAIGDINSLIKNREEVKILSEQQQKWVFSQNNNQNFLFDVTGSGKTNVLISKAIYLIEQNKNNPPKILLATYNDNLKRNIERLFKSKVVDIKDRERYLNYVTIDSIPSLFRHFVEQFLEESSGNEESDKSLLEDILKVKENTEKLKIFDYIFLDEIQDFDTRTLRILKYFAKAPHFFFVGDIGQKIYPREFNLNALGLNFSKMKLDKSFFMYRTPKYIAQLATEFILTDEWTSNQFAQNEYRPSNFDYKNPFNNLAEIIKYDEVLSTLYSIFKRGYNPSDIMIITSEKLISNVERELKTANLDFTIGIHEDQTGITIIDFMNVKGLEKKVVIIIGIEDLYHPFRLEAQMDSEHEKKQKESLTKRLIYIALTRTLEQLILLYKDDTNPYIATLLQINKKIIKKRLGV